VWGTRSNVAVLRGKSGLPVKHRDAKYAPQDDVKRKTKSKASRSENASYIDQPPDQRPRPYEAGWATKTNSEASGLKT
jgi:hypothetical protein